MLDAMFMAPKTKRKADLAGGTKRMIFVLWEAEASRPITKHRSNRISLV